jgi:signal peptidase
MMTLISVGTLLFGTVTPFPSGIEIKIVQSGSMEPSISTGSLVIIYPQDTYNIGDVITYGEDSGGAVPTTHRVIDKEEQNGEVVFTTKGDANEEPDPEAVPRSDVIGGVMVSVPTLGYILDFARTPLGFALLVGIPAAHVVLEESMYIWRRMRLWIERKRASAVAPVTDTNASSREAQQATPSGQSPPQEGAGGDTQYTRRTDARRRRRISRPPSQRGGGS